MILFYGIGGLAGMHIERGGMSARILFIKSLYPVRAITYNRGMVSRGENIIRGDA